jgi:hypothetical protein
VHIFAGRSLLVSDTADSGIYGLVLALDATMLSIASDSGHLTQIAPYKAYFTVPTADLSNAVSAFARGSLHLGPDAAYWLVIGGQVVLNWLCYTPLIYLLFRAKKAFLG